MYTESKRKSIENITLYTRTFLGIKGPITLDILIQKLETIGIVCISDGNITTDSYIIKLDRGENLFEIHYDAKKKREHILFSIASELGRILLYMD